MAYITKQTEVAMSVVADYLMYNFSIRKWYGGGGGDGLFIQIHIPSGISPKPTDSWVFGSGIWLSASWTFSRGDS